MGTFTISASIVYYSDYTTTAKRSLRQDGPSNRHPGHCPSETLYEPSFYHHQPTPVSPPGLCSPIYHVLISLFRLRVPDHALAQLFDSAEPVPFQTVRQVIHSELGKWPEGLFIEFDEKPLGSAVRRPLLSSPPSLKYLPTLTPDHQH